MKKSIVFLLALACFFAGGFVGFIISPAKQGFGNNSGNTNNFYAYKKEEIAEILQTGKTEDKED